MRQTLHILPLHLAVTAHHATLRQRLGPCRSRLRNLGRSERALRAVASRLRAEIADMPVPYRVLEAKLAASGHPGDLALARLAIKWLWETGELAHVDLSPSLHHEHRAFALTDARFPGLGLRPQPPDLDAACDELVRHHIRAFGPVSIDDTAWWSGLGRATVRRAVDRHASEFVRVRVAGISEDLLLAGEDANDLVSAKPLDPRQVTLLAHEDPALKGYFSTRTRYVAPDNYNQLFNSIGEARPSIMCGGQVIGIWTFDRRARRVVHTLLRPVPRTARKAIRDLLLDIEGFLRAEPVHGATGVPGAPVGPLG